MSEIVRGLCKRGYTIALLHVILVTGSVLFAFLTWLFNGRKISTRFCHLGWQLGAAALVESAGSFPLLKNVDNSLLYNIYLPIEFMVLLLITTIPRRWVVWMLALGCMIWAYDFHWLGSSGRLVVYFTIVAAVVLTGSYLQQLWYLTLEIDEGLFKDPHFLFYLSNVLYFGATAPLVASVNYLNSANPHLAVKLWWVILGFCIVRYVLVGMACLKGGRRTDTVKA